MVSFDTNDDFGVGQTSNSSMYLRGAVKFYLGVVHLLRHHGYGGGVSPNDYSNTPLTKKIRHVVFDSSLQSCGGALIIYTNDLFGGGLNDK